MSRTLSILASFVALSGCTLTVESTGTQHEQVPAVSTSAPTRTLQHASLGGQEGEPFLGGQEGEPMLGGQEGEPWLGGQEGEPNAEDEPMAPAPPAGADSDPDAFDQGRVDTDDTADTGAP